MRGALLHCDSLCEIPAGKNLKQLVVRHRRAIRQASGSQLPPPRPPLERLLAKQLPRYMLAESDVFEYVQSATGATAFAPPNETVSLCAILRTLRVDQR